MIIINSCSLKLVHLTLSTGMIVIRSITKQNTLIKYDDVAVTIQKALHEQSSSKLGPTEMYKLTRVEGCYVLIFCKRVLCYFTHLTGLMFNYCRYKSVVTKQIALNLSECMARNYFSSYFVTQHVEKFLKQNLQDSIRLYLQLQSICMRRAFFF